MSAHVLGSPALGIEEAERRLASARLGRSDLITWFLPLAAQGPNPFNSIGGTGAIPWVSGALSFATGAGAGGFARVLLYPDAGGNFGRLIRAGADWALSSRFAVTTTVTAQTQAITGAETSAGTGALYMGVNGGVSAVNFTCKGTAGAAINSGVPIDTLFHTHRAWRTGGQTFYQVDNTIVSGTADVAADSMPYLIVQNGTDAVNRALSAIWMAAYAPSL